MKIELMFPGHPGEPIYANWDAVPRVDELVDISDSGLMSGCYHVTHVLWFYDRVRVVLK